MGYGGYDTQARTLRADAQGFATATATDARVFVQAAKREVNEGMDPRLIDIREARDGPDHPCTVPVILALDETGSMGRIPVNLIRHQLPVLMTALLAIHPDVTLCFMAVGDDRCDVGPLQVGQFEASDEQLDHWLTRSWLEGNGGGNGGESYALPWLFSINKIQTDAWDKRGQKGLLITVGDEPLHQQYERTHLERLFSSKYGSVVEGLEGNGVFLAPQIHARASEKWDLHHVALGGKKPGWDVLGEQCHVIGGEGHVVEAIVSIFRQHVESLGIPQPTQATQTPSETPASPPANSIPEAL